MYYFQPQPSFGRGLRCAECVRQFSWCGRLLPKCFHTLSNFGHFRKSRSTHDRRAVRTKKNPQKRWSQLERFRNILVRPKGMSRKLFLHSSISSLCLRMPLILIEWLHGWTFLSQPQSPPGPATFAPSGMYQNYCKPHNKHKMCAIWVHSSVSANLCNTLPESGSRMELDSSVNPCRSKENIQKENSHAYWVQPNFSFTKQGLCCNFFCPQTNHVSVLTI